MNAVVTPRIFILWLTGYSPGGLYSGVLGTKSPTSPPEAEAVSGHYLQILTAETIKI